MKTPTKIQQWALSLGIGLPVLLHPLWSRFARDLSAEDFLQGQKVVYIIQVVYILLVWVWLTFSAKNRENRELHKNHHKSMLLATSLVVVVTVIQWRSSKNTVDQSELNSWLATYDPFLEPEEGDLSFIYRDLEEFVGALSLEERSGHEPAIEAARAGAADYIRGATLSDLRKEWLGLSLRSGLLSVDQIEEEQLSSIAEELMAKLAVERDRHPGVVMPMFGFKDRLYQVLLLADSQLLPVEDRELLAEKIVAGVTWEVRRQGPDKWMELRKHMVNDLPVSLTIVRCAVDMLVALDAKAALEEVEGMVLEALKNNYRPTDDSGVAGFVHYAEHAGGEDMNARYLGSADPAEGHALSLMERYGFPDFVDVQAVHKHFINASMGHSKPSGPFGEIHDGDEYLSAALRFRLEQLYPEL